MKTAKKFFAMVLAVLMVMSLAATAFADETVTNSTNHDYKAYQIFSGTQGEGSALGDIVWGSGIDAAKANDLMEELKKEEVFADCADAAAIAKVLAEMTGNDPVVLKFAKTVSKYLSTTATDIKSGASSVAMDAGYYLLVDQKETDGVTDEVKGLSLLQVTKEGNIEIKLKTDKPSVDKEVWDEADDDDKEADENWGETADHDICEEFRFRLTATIPAGTMTNFAAYKIIFTDTMSAGITFVKIDSVAVNGTETDAYTSTAAANQAGDSWTLTLDDVRTAVANLNTEAEVKVVVTYTAKLNANAVIHNPGNPNTVGLQYSNNPNVNGEGELGKTVEDTVWVFTYQIDGTKVDGTDKKALADAKFVLYKTVDGVNTYAVMDADNKLVKWEAATTDADGNTVYPDGSEMTTGKDGKIQVIGLDHGTYKLQEIKAPAGYNLLTTPTDLVIKAVHEEEADKNNAKTVFAEDSVTSVNVENQRGSTLPETGGMGTTLFYLIGGILVAAAVVLLVTKKRMTNEE